MSRALSIYPEISIPLKKRTMISIAFDDGYDTDYTRALPILKDNGIRGTSFVCNNRRFHEDEVLTPEQIKEMADSGHEIGCHSLIHPHLTDVTNLNTLISQFKDNKAWIESITGKTVYTHAYPYGDTNDHVSHICGGFYEGARGFGSHSNRFGDNSEKGYFVPYGYEKSHEIPGRFIDGLPVSSVKTFIDNFLTWGEQNGGGLLVLSWRKIWGDLEEGKPDNRWTESQFREVIEYIAPLKESGEIDIVPFYEAVRRIK